MGHLPVRRAVCLLLALVLALPAPALAAGRDAEAAVLCRQVHLERRQALDDAGAEEDEGDGAPAGDEGEDEPSAGDEGACGGHTTWSLREGVLTISGAGATEDYDFLHAQLPPWAGREDEIHTLVVEQGVTGLGDALCYGLSRLAAVTLPDSLEEVGAWAFFNCGKLGALTLPEGVHTIGEYAFYNCRSLERFTLPKDVDSCGAGLLCGCSKLAGIEVAGGNETFKSQDGVLLTLDGATLLQYPAGRGAGEGYEIPEGVREIAPEAFDGCALLSVSVPESVRTIGAYAFAYCEDLADVYYAGGQDGWRAISIGARNDWLEQARIHFRQEQPDGKGTCGEGLTWQLRGGVLTVSGQGAIDDYASCEAAPWARWNDKISKVVLEEGVARVGAHALGKLTALRQVEMPGSLREIGAEAFASCFALTSMSLPEGLTALGGGAFDCCYALEEVSLPASLATLGTGAFSRCGQLREITTAEGGGHFRAVGGVLFSQDGAVLYCCPPAREETSYAIPGGTVEIASWAFSGSLAAVTIPKSVKTIRAGAFRCDSLAHVYYAGSLQDWQGITIGEDNQSLTGASFHCQEEEDPADAYGVCGEGLTWALRDGTLTISGEGEMYDFTSDTVPWAAHRQAVEELVVEQGATGIGAYAFSGLPALARAALPETLNSIGDYAFQEDGALSSLPLPGSLRVIGKWAFSRCAALESVQLPDGLVTLGPWAFYECGGLTRAAMPEDLTDYGVGAFARCARLEEFTVAVFSDHLRGEDGVLMSFNGTTLLQYPAARPGDAYTVPDGVEAIAGEAFSGSALAAVTIPRSVTAIGMSAFSGCESLADVYYAGNLSEWQEVEIGQENACLTGARLHCQGGGDEADASGACGADLTWQLRNGVLTITGTGAMDDYITSYSSPWGAYLDRIERVEVEQGVESVGRNAFEYCVRLTSVNLPGSVSRVGSYAFYGCKALNSVTMADGLTEIGESAFGLTGITSVSLPGSLKYLGDGAFGNCRSLVELAAPDSGRFRAMDGVLFNQDGSALLQYPAGKEGTGYEIPASVTSIAGGAFEGCARLTQVSIPRSVTYIGPMAFYQCSALAGVTVPEGVETLETYCFKQCGSLARVCLPRSVGRVKSGAFDQCGALEDVYYAGTQEEWGWVRVYEENAPLRSARFHYESAGPDGPAPGDALTITLDPNGGAVAPGSIQARPGKPYGALPTPTRAGHLFSGWFTALEDGERVTGESVVGGQEDHVLYARWQQGVTVTFDPNGGTLPAGRQSSKVVLSGQPYGELPVPEKRGCSFDGWYTAAAGGDVVTATTTASLTDDHTLYAHWTDLSQPTRPAVTTGEARDVRKNSAVLTGTLDEAGDGSGLACQFVYWDMHDPDSRYTAPATVEEGGLSATILNLSPSTTYYYFARAVSSAGEGAGGTLSFTTAQEERQPVSVSVSPTYITLEAGQSCQMLATVLPADAANRAVVWSSDDTGVATVDAQGKVTAVAPGSTRVTATTQVGRLTAVSTVSVTEASAPDLSGEFDFSEWHMASHCANTAGRCGFGYSIDEGGNYLMSTAYLARWEGAVVENRDPYPTDHTCPPLSSVPANYHVQEALWIAPRANPLDNGELKAAVMNYGAAYVNFLVNWSYFDATRTNYYYPEDGSGASGGHAVTLVGWDDDYPAASFVQQPPGNGAFICKNSWGTGSGEDGFFYISYYDKYFARLGNTSMVVPSLERATNYNTIYQYDPLGACGALGNNRSIYACNVFPARQDETLRAVSFYTYDKNTSYEVYAVTDYRDALSLNDRGAAIASGTIQEMGYHTIPLNADVRVRGGSSFAVIVKLSVPSGYAWMYYEYPLSGYSDNAGANPGESFSSVDGVSWQDLTTMVSGANFCLKAFTDNGAAATSAQLYEGVPEQAESGRAYTVEEALAAGIPISDAYLEWLERRDDPALSESGQDETMGVIPPLVSGGDNTVSFVDGAVFPRKYDLRDEGYVSPVRNQGEWGTCWAHATYASLESCLLKKARTLAAVVPGGMVMDTLASVGSAGVAATAMSISEDAVTMACHATHKLTVSFQPLDAARAAVIWSSSDETVACVDTNGVITAFKPGTTVITARTPDGLAAGNRCTVTVTAGVAASGVRMESSALTRLVGDVFMVKFDVQPAAAADKSVTWSSDNPEVVYVDELYGNMQARASGTAVITATSTDGGHKGTVTVTVLEAGEVGLALRHELGVDEQEHLVGKVYVSVTGGAQAQGTGSVILAAYQQERLVGSWVKVTELAPGQRTVEFDVDVAGTECKLRCFALDDKQAPLGNNAETTVENDGEVSP